MSRLLRHRLLLAGLLGVLVAGSIIALLVVEQLRAPISCGCTIPPTGDWILRQRAVQGTPGLFIVDDAQISGADLRLFYAFESAQHSAPLVTVTSSTSAKPLPAQVQVLGQIGDINVGVLHTIHPDHTGQTLTLAISSSDGQRATLRFTVLEQQHGERDTGDNRFAVMVVGDGTDEYGQPFSADAQPHVEFFSIWTSEGKTGSFTLRTPGQSTANMLYFRSDASVILISKQEFDGDVHPSTSSVNISRSYAD